MADVSICIYAKWVREINKYTWKRLAEIIGTKSLEFHFCLTRPAPNWPHLTKGAAVKDELDIFSLFEFNYSFRLLANSI